MKQNQYEIIVLDLDGTLVGVAVLSSAPEKEDPGDLSG